MPITPFGQRAPAKHILVEKPLALSEDEALAMIAAARSANVLLMTAYRLHNEPGTVAVLEHIRANAIGRPLLFQSVFSFQTTLGNHRLKATTWGGPLQDIGVYCVNAARHIFDTTITHFYELAVTGERILLSIRYGDWSDIENIQEQATNWARSCRSEIQRYIYAYQTVTGVDLSSDVVDSRDATARYLPPSMHLQRRLAGQTSAMRLRSPAAPDLVTARTSARIAAARVGQPKLPTYRKGS
jgi:hypothetical protein